MEFERSLAARGLLFSQGSPKAPYTVSRNRDSAYLCAKIGTAVDISVDRSAVFTYIQATICSVPAEFTSELLFRVIYRQFITIQDAAFRSVGFFLFIIINTVFPAEKRKLLSKLTEWNLNEILVV